jgi:hypothetical protein
VVAFGRWDLRGDWMPVMTIRPRDIISHWEMCQAEQRNLQQGMNFQPGGRRSIILMSLRPGAPYADRFEDDGRVLIYEGHDVHRSVNGPDPKSVDQLGARPSGRLTDNGRFEAAALRHRDLDEDPELVHVYEKIKPNIWTFRGVFRLVNAWTQPDEDGRRRVYKFKLEIVDGAEASLRDAPRELQHTRAIPSDVMRTVWARDEGRCVTCGSTDNLHFDHILPFSKGGASITAQNIQLLCARHNLEKSDRIG